MRGFIDDPNVSELESIFSPASQSAFVRGFIDDDEAARIGKELVLQSQSAFVRGFIDDIYTVQVAESFTTCLNPRSCAASSMTSPAAPRPTNFRLSQSAFVRGFIDDAHDFDVYPKVAKVSIRVRARLHR